MNKIKVFLNLDNENYPSKPGDGYEYYDSDKVLKLAWCCPKCGQTTTTAKGSNHNWEPKTKSLTPSIIHSKELGGCGWHGWLKNGEFIEC